jgi:hypothetical protein
MTESSDALSLTGQHETGRSSRPLSDLRVAPTLGRATELAARPVSAGPGDTESTSVDGRAALDENDALVVNVARLARAVRELFASWLPTWLGLGTTAATSSSGLTRCKRKTPGSSPPHPP